MRDIGEEMRQSWNGAPPQPEGGQDLARQLRWSSSQMTRVGFLPPPRSPAKSCPRGLTRVPPRAARVCAALLTLAGGLGVRAQVPAANSREVLTYDIEWRLIPAGSAKLTLTG